MKNYKKQDLEFALNLLEISQQELDASNDLKKLELQIRKRWHPDRVVGLGLDDSHVDRFTRISQKISTCFEIFDRYKKEKENEKKVKKTIKRRKGNKNRILFKKIMLLNKAGKIAEAENLAAKFLAEATLNKDKQLIKELLNFGTDIDGGFSGLPPLCFAVKENDLETVRFLLSLGASPNVEMNGSRVIVYALENKNLELVEALLEPGADPNKHNNESAKRVLMVGDYVKWTLLMDRISKDDLSFIKLLIKYGADINAKTFEPGWNALLEAVKNKRIDIVKYLLSSGADPHYKNKNGVNARHLARISGNGELISIIQEYSDKQ